MRFFSLSALLFLMIGCGARSIYNSSYYSETALENDLIRVTFKGGKPPMTGDLCLLRCAEITMEKDMKYFEVVDSESGNSFYSIPSAYPFHNHQIHDDPFLNDIPHVTKTIRLFKNEPGNDFVYDAEVIWSSIRRKYEISED